MNLATKQRKILGLIKSTYQVIVDDDPYIEFLSSSPQLALVRKIVTWWQEYSIEQYCPLTARILKEKLFFEDAVNGYVTRQRVSPFIEQFGAGFLRMNTHHPDNLVASVAQFEHALVRVRRGDPHEYTVIWERDPLRVLEALLSGRAIDEQCRRGRFVARVSRHISGLFEMQADPPNHGRQSTVL